MRTRVGHYDVVCELGRGGMGVVYKGFEGSLNRYVAIKTLSESLSNDESVKERFLREARSMALLNDAHIIQIYFIGEDQGQPYFAMEFVEGESLSSFLKREGKMTPAQAAKVVYQTAIGLASAHDKGVVHRDIKPANLMLTTRGTIKIADFGIALAQHDLSKKLTATGEFVGTPGYLSPEVCLAKPTDLRSDIFSLGIVLFEMLTGRMPFTDESPLGLMLEVVKAEIPDVRELNGEVDVELAQILTRMVAKEPVDRFQSCHELITALQTYPAIQQGGPITAKAKLPAAASTVIGSLPTPVGQVHVTLPTAPALAAAHPTQATAQSLPPAAPALAAAAAVVGPPRRSGALWAVAAAVLLAVLATTAYAFRDRLLAFGGGAVASSSNGTAAEAGHAQADPAATHTGIAGAEDDSGADEDTGEAPGLRVLHELAENQKALAEGGSAPNTAAPTLIAEPEAGSPAAAEPARPAVAKAALAPRGPPKVMVVSVGDRGIALATEQRLETALRAAGFLLADEDALSGVHGLLGTGRPNVPRLLVAAARHNVHAVTVIRAEPLGSSELKFYGRTDTLYSVNLQVKSYDAFKQTAIGAGFNSKVDFTNTNAELKAGDAVAAVIDAYLDDLAAYRPSGSGG
ncbi:MAG: serine/threonine-protein kinase [Lysobacterales bacterium]